jgi:ribosome maturation factor RimP
MRPEELIDIVEPVLKQLGIDLVDLMVRGKGDRYILCIFVDEVGGICIDRVAEASRAISDLLDQTAVIPTRYTLEVSSPGADRPLKTERDFIRNIGRKVKIQYATDELIETLTGNIVDASGERVSLETKNGISILEIGRIKSAVIIFEF